MGIFSQVAAQAATERGENFMSATTRKPPEIPGPQGLKLPDPVSSENQSSHLPASESSQKSKDHEEVLRRIAEKESAPEQEESKPAVRLFSLAKGKDRKSEVTTDDVKNLVAAAQPPESKKRKRSLWKSHKGFPKKFPELFWMKGSDKVFDDAWRHSKKTGKGGLRFEGYKKDVSKRTGVCYHQVKKIWKFFEAKHLFLFVLQGRKNLRNLGVKGKRAYLPSIDMLPWSPAHFEKLQRERRKAAAAAVAKSSRA